MRPLRHALTAALILAACSSTAPTAEEALAALPDRPACDVSDVNLEGQVVESGESDDLIVEHLTGYVGRRQGAGDFRYNAPNFGASARDQTSPSLWLVLVVDCSATDLAEVLRLGGGPDAVTVLETPHSYDEVEDYRAALYADLSERGIDGDVGTHVSRKGRMLLVTVDDPTGIPDEFGADVPADVFVLAPRADEEVPVDLPQGVGPAD